MAVKEWYIQVFKKEEGPFTLLELRADRRITPDTLVWKEGFENWVPARDVEELKVLFEEEKKPSSAEIIRPFADDTSKTDDVLALEYDPKQWFTWLIIIIAVLLYVIYQLA